MPETILRGGYSETPPAYTRWDGLSFGAQLGYSNLNADFTSATAAGGLAKATSNSPQYGGFIGYNIQWDDLVIGFEGAYDRQNSLTVSSASSSASSSLKLIDYATFRARAGYAFGQFLPYAFLGGAAGRFNYATVEGTQISRRDNQYAAGFTAGLGIDVAVLPNVFVRAEYEYVLFSPFGDIRTNMNTARAGIGVRF